MKGAAHGLTTADVYEALQKRYKDPEYILLREVRNQTGYEKNTSYADAMAFSTWPSRGLEIIGMEIKVSRSDWLREKKNPKKAEDLFRYCDKWYLVMTPDVARLDEIPKTWGVILLKGRRLTVEVEAPALEPQSPTRAFLASLLRNASVRSASQAELKAARREASDETRRLFEGQGERALSSEREGHERLKKVVHDFEVASGVKLNAWVNGAQIGEAVQVVLRGGLTHVMREVENAKRDLQRQVRSLERFLEIHDVIRESSPTKAADALQKKIASDEDELAKASADAAS